jgi:hypothetical protein
MNISYMSMCIYHLLSLECLNNFIEFLVELFRKMMTITLFNCEILKLSVMANSSMIIYDFLVIEIQTIPFIFAHFTIVKDFQLCDFMRFISDFIQFLCHK